MIRANRAPDWVTSGWRLFTPFLVLALILSFDSVSPGTVRAGASADLAAMRQAQVRAESSMRRADRQIKRLRSQRRQHAVRLARAKHKLDRLIDRRNAAQARAGRALSHLDDQRIVLGRKLRVHPNPSGVQLSDKPKLRRRVRKLEARTDQLERKARKLRRKVEKARAVKQARLSQVGRSRIVARKAARERAEDKLGSRITGMLELAQQRASSGFGPASTRRFRRPARGIISQGFGCQQTRKTRNGKRICTRYHDGIDIAAPRGTKVRASADGYVAYVGWNPWDSGKRAYVVIIGHARGYETIYGHLEPVRKVRAGQKVRRGEVIGVMGSTGRSTGPHVHWEVSRAFRTIDPFRAGH